MCVLSLLVCRTPLGPQCSILMPLAWAIGQHGCPHVVRWWWCRPGFSASAFSCLLIHAPSSTNVSWVWFPLTMTVTLDQRVWFFNSDWDKIKGRESCRSASLPFLLPSLMTARQPNSDTLRDAQTQKANCCAQIDLHSGWDSFRFILGPFAQCDEAIDFIHLWWESLFAA